MRGESLKNRLSPFSFLAEQHDWRKPRQNPTRRQQAQIEPNQPGCLVLWNSISLFHCRSRSNGQTSLTSSFSRDRSSSIAYCRDTRTEVGPGPASCEEMHHSICRKRLRKRIRWGTIPQSRNADPFAIPRGRAGRMRVRALESAPTRRSLSIAHLDKPKWACHIRFSPLNGPLFLLSRVQVP